MNGRLKTGKRTRRPESEGEKEARKPTFAIGGQRYKTPGKGGRHKDRETSRTKAEDRRNWRLLTENVVRED